jgi:protein-tyrosine phosphatase
MERLIELKGCLNFRDLGGYPTADGRRIRWRQLFRSDALHHLTDEDVRKLNDELGITDIVDLRSTAELRSDGRGPLAKERMRFHHLPLFDGDIIGRSDVADAFTLADRYFLLAEFAKAPIAKVLNTLSEASGPAVYHCAAGKDRTGVISAVILGVLGVKHEIIVADYAATKQNLDAIIERLMATKGYKTMLSALPPDTMHAEPETMIALLERVHEKYGSMREYAREAGVSEGTLQRLEARMLE